MPYYKKHHKLIIADQSDPDSRPSCSNNHKCPCNPPPPPPVIDFSTKFAPYINRQHNINERFKALSTRFVSLSDSSDSDLINCNVLVFDDDIWNLYVHLNPNNASIIDSS